MSRKEKLRHLSNKEKHNRVQKVMQIQVKLNKHLQLMKKMYQKNNSDLFD
jgi:hypothetical protein